MQPENLDKIKLVASNSVIEKAKRHWNGISLTLAENSYTSIEDSSREDDLPLMCLICPDKGKMKVTTAAATTSSTHGDTFTRCEMIRKASSC
ncbi:hypothetical protein RRG08_035289 [Elysia crispata]|uniref:Uncharacterized protein n=1 Tax=Elysia crispata TaxID=231223 RepID=A0AAE1D3T1_9GAST|nr:hypothetical protein RRG08_035289 [Elysia crispata]